MSAVTRPRRLGLYIPWALFAALALAWTGYWMALRTRMIHAVEASIAAEARAGGKISYARVSGSGYPLRLTLRFENASYEAPGGAWSLAAPLLDLHINPSNLDLVILEPHGPVTWRHGETIRTFTPRIAALSLARQKGALARAILETHDLSIDRAGDQPAFVKTLVIGVRRDPRNGADAQMSVDADGVTLAATPDGAEGLGATISSLEARLVIERADAMTAARAAPFDAWRAAGGALRVESAGALWGPVRAVATGRVALDAQRRPSGALDLVLTMTASPPGPSGARTAALDIAARAAAAKGAPARLTIEDGVMRLGPAIVRRVDPLE